jgi:hypothetical protein
MKWRGTRDENKKCIQNLGFKASREEETGMAYTGWQSSNVLSETGCAGVNWLGMGSSSGVS